MRLPSRLCRLLMIITLVVVMATVGKLHGTSALAIEDGAEPLASQWLSDDQIRSAFRGQTIDGVYADRRTFVERYAEDGGLDYIEPYRRNVGRWSVKGSAFCTLYDRDPTGGCYRVRRLSANCFAFYFVSRSEEQAVKDPLEIPAWTARGWVRGKASTCEDAATV